MLRPLLGLSVLLLLLWPPAAAGQGAASSKAQAAEARLRPRPPESVPPAQLEAAIARGVAYLCKNQNRDGSWGSARWTGGVDRDPVPGAFHSFNVAVTAMCLEALLAAPDSPEVRQAASGAQAYLVEQLPKLRIGLSIRITSCGCSCPCSRRTAPGPTTRCTATTKPTARPSRS